MYGSRGAKVMSRIQKRFPVQNGCGSSLSTQTFCGDGRTASKGMGRERKEGR